MRENKSSYEWVTLRKTNVKYVSEQTGISPKELRVMLEAAAKKGRYELKLPLGTKVFTREEK